jgi:hypothetical protein
MVPSLLGTLATAQYLLMGRSMKDSAIGTALVIASALSSGCFGPGPGYDHREVVYVDHSHDRDHSEHRDDHHDEHHNDQGH